MGIGKRKNLEKVLRITFNFLRFTYLSTFYLVYNNNYVEY
ncbi:hypothetical protein LD85_0850 [Saccharolobus islandicus L.D.8.5]|uniref:Uncharacterized protein n=1 Tax=Saccharolobus islandicus (strain L.D.8.5 / Lassen \|nr:hypothetical protein LD85_0850 [Sulfolobus islandicus L.D.8.5]